MSKSTAAIGMLGAYLAFLTCCVADEDSNSHLDPRQALFLGHICKIDTTHLCCVAIGVMSESEDRMKVNLLKTIST